MKTLLSIEKATAKPVATGNIIPYLIFRFHEEMSICRFHELSHSHASLLANMGINIQEVARRLEHAKIEMTWNTYSHLYPREEERAIAVLNQV